MPEVLTITLSKQENGVKLTLRYGSKNWGHSYLQTPPDFIIDLLNKGFIERGLPLPIDGKIFSIFSESGPASVSKKD